MPRLTVWMARTALLYLGVGFTLGALLLLNKGLPIHPALWRLLPLHIEAVLVGWTVQLALGVAHWIMPRFIDRGRGDERPAWAGYVILNAGVLLVWIGAWLAVPALTFGGRAAELLAAALIGIGLWPRVKPLGA